MAVFNNCPPTLTLGLRQLLSRARRAGCSHYLAPRQQLCVSDKWNHKAEPCDLRLEDKPYLNSDMSTFPRSCFCFIKAPPYTALTQQNLHSCQQFRPLKWCHVNGLRCHGFNMSVFSYLSCHSKFKLFQHLDTLYQHLE